MGSIVLTDYSPIGRFYFSHMVSKDTNLRYPHVVSLALDNDNDKVGYNLFSMHLTSIFGNLF